MNIKEYIELRWEGVKNILDHSMYESIKEEVVLEAQEELLWELLEAMESEEIGL